jgi:superfamily II DNA or RNA helicase
MLEIICDSHLRIDGLSEDWLVGLSKLCSVQNEDKQTAINEHVYGAEWQDDLLTLAEVTDDGQLILPRGFLHELQFLLNDAGWPNQTIDRTRYCTAPPEFDNRNTTFPRFKQEQADALNAMHKTSQGRIIAPPGKGKTIIGLGFIQSKSQNSLIIVDKKHIAQQWIDRAEEHFNLEVGFIGDNRWEEKPVTVALIQTLWSRRNDIYQDFWDRWSILLHDEQHHIPAETYTQIISSFPAHWRYGLSATIGKSPAKKRISELIFGPILYETEKSDLKPIIKIVETGFDFGYHPTHKRKVGNKTKVIRNNYTEMISALVDDWERNGLIAETVEKNSDFCNLIVSNRLKHLDSIVHILMNILDPNTTHRIYMLTGEESLEERMEIYKLADKSNCSIFSTLGVAGEALDIPRIDRIHLAFPMKNEETVWQVIGRGARLHENKDSCIIFDYKDEVEVLKNQHLHRLRKVYQKRELEVQSE